MGTNQSDTESGNPVGLIGPIRVGTCKLSCMQLYASRLVCSGVLVGIDQGSFALGGARPPPEDSRDSQNIYPSHMRANLFTPDTCGQMFRRATVEQVDVELPRTSSFRTQYFSSGE